MSEHLQDLRREVWGLRRTVVRHPVHRWCEGSVDRTTLLGYKGFCQWGSTVLSASLPIGQPGHRMSEVTAPLQARGAGRCLDSFLGAIGQGTDPVAAVEVAGAPAAVVPLVTAVTRLLSDGSEAARLGALALGLPCCDDDQAWALNRLAMLTTDDPSVNVEAVVAAHQVLEAQVALYDGAAETIRRRHMTMHPSAGGSGAPARRFQLLPAG